MKLLEIEKLQVAYGTGRSRVVAVSEFDFTLEQGESLALVGESGSGKSSIAGCITGLVKPASGTIRFRGSDLATLSASERRRAQRQVGVVFQNPYTSLNPRMTVRNVLTEALRLREDSNRFNLDNQVNDALQAVGLPASFVSRLPHQLSGGQRQRVAIARALALKPGLLVLDEPTAALDVSVQAQIINLLASLRRRGISILYITHNLATVPYLAEHVVVLKLGRVMERGLVRDVFANPQDPYTQTLLAAAPSFDAVK